MSIIRGTIPATATNELRIAQLRALFVDNLADVFPLVDESSVSLHFSIPHSGGRRFYFSLTPAYEYIVVRNLADTGEVFSYNNVGYNPSTPLPYTIVKNSNSGFLTFSGLTFAWGTCGSLDSGAYFVGSGQWATKSDAALTSMLSTALIATPPRVLADGNELVFPVYASDDTNSYLLTEPVTDWYVFRNSKSVASWLSIIINSVEYVVVSGTKLIRVNP